MAADELKKLIQGFYFLLTIEIALFAILGSISTREKESFQPDADSSPSMAAFCPRKNPQNLYYLNFKFDFYAFLSENETHVDSQPIWTKRGWSYGDLSSSFAFTMNVPISEV